MLTPLLCNIAVTGLAGTEGANANNKKTRPPHGDLASSLLLVEYLFCLYWKVTYEKVFCYYLLSISCYS